MNEKEKKELTIEVTDEVAAKMAADPEMEAVLKNLFAAFHQAHHAVQTGQYKSMEDAMEAITGCRPVPLDEDDPDVPEAVRGDIKKWQKWRRERS